MTTNTASSAPRPKRLLTASGKLLDASNSAAPTLSAHKHAIEAKRASDDAAKRHQSSTSGWDGMVEDLVDDEGFVDHDEDDVFVQDIV